jgi:hypothetical protein
MPDSTGAPDRCPQFGGTVDHGDHWSGAGGDEDVVGRESGGEADEEPPHDRLLLALAAGDRDELEDDMRIDPPASARNDTGTAPRRPTNARAEFRRRWVRRR